MTRVAREVGTEGKLGGQAAGARRRRHLEGPHRQRQLRWPSNLTGQVRNIAEVTTAVAQRRPLAEDHGRRQGRDPRAEEHHQHDGRSAQRASPREVTRVAREVGTEGKLGGQAQVPGVAGTWKDLTDNVNFDGRQPHRPGAQHRRGRRPPSPTATCRKKITVDVRGEILAAQEHHQHDGRPAARRSPPK